MDKPKALGNSKEEAAKPRPTTAWKRSLVELLGSVEKLLAVEDMEVVDDVDEVESDVPLAEL